ncbi:MAG: JAB domain-containing protein [Lachnospiraceae bacterium]|nr:JAB domain-containing protein [Lachnospiraceae bacterium]
MEITEPFQLDVVSVRLVRNAPIFSDKKITTPEDAVSLVGELLCEMDREVLCVINLKSDGTPINCNFASMGAINQAIAEPRELFKSAILSNAAAMILLHNHPSGRLEPSKEDTIMTDRLLKLSVLLGIPLKDHVIVGGDNSRYFSFKEKEMLDMPKITLTQNYHYLEFENRALIAEPGRSR